MVSENLEKALGRAIFDDNFRKKWLNDFDNQSDDLDIADVRERIKAEHFLRDFERYKSEKEIGSSSSSSSGGVSSNKKNSKGDEKINEASGSEVYSKDKSEQLNPADRHRFEKNESAASASINDYIFLIFQQSIEDSRKFFKKIFYISYGVFAIGMIMFIISFLSGTGSFGSGVSVSSTIIFGVMGIVILLIYFIYDPSRRVQLGISNILKIEMIFMNFWDQVNFWRPYGNSNEDEKKKEASDQMHMTARTSIEFLQKYLDDQTSIRRKLNSILSSSSSSNGSNSSSTDARLNDLDSNPLQNQVESKES